MLKEKVLGNQKFQNHSKILDCFITLCQNLTDLKVCDTTTYVQFQKLVQKRQTKFLSSCILAHAFLRIFLAVRNMQNRLRTAVTDLIVRGSLHESELSFNPEQHFKLNSCLHGRLS